MPNWIRASATSSDDSECRSRRSVSTVRRRDLTPLQGYELGTRFDIGGTFTDFALLNTESGELEIFKALTTAEHPEVGALAGLATFLRECGICAMNRC